jgi:hypothetical protein
MQACVGSRPSPRESLGEVHHHEGIHPQVVPGSSCSPSQLRPQCLCPSPSGKPRFRLDVHEQRGALVFSPLRDDWDWNKKKRKKVAASEGGNAALYLMFAGLACGSAVLLRSRQTSAAKSA